MRAFLTRLIKICLVLLLFSACFIALLPTLVSTEWGRKQVVYWVNRSIPGKIEIRALDLHWTKGQDLQGILLKDPQGHSVLQIEKLSTEATLWQLFRKSTHLGYTQIIDLNAAIQTNEKGSTNLHEALGIAQATVSTAPLFHSATLLSDVNVELYLFSKSHPLSALIRGITKQDKLNGSFEINVALQTLQASNWDELKQDVQQYLSIEGSKDAEIQAHVNNFPVDLLDRVASLFNPHLKGVFHSLLGDRLNLSIEKEPSQEGLAFKLNAQSPLMQGDLIGNITNGLITVQQPGIFLFNLTPEFINPFFEERLTLLNATLLKVNLQSLTFPLDFLDSDANMDPCQVAFTTQYSLPKTDIAIPTIGQLSLVNLQANVNTQACAINIEFLFDGKALQNHEAFDFHVDLNLKKPIRFANLQREILQHLHGTINISHFPLQLIPLFQQKPELLELIGSTLDSQLKIASKGQSGWETILSLHTPKLELKETKMQLEKEELYLAKPAQIDLILSRNCLNALSNKSDLTIAQPCPVTVVLNNFRVPFFSSDDMGGGKFQIEASVPAIQFSQLFSWGSLGFEAIDLNMEGKDFTHFATKLKGRVSLLQPNRSLSPLLNEPAAFDLSSNWVVGKDKKLEMSFGHFEVKNSFLNAEAEGKISSSAILELTQPIHFNYLLSPLALDSINELLAKNIPKLKNNADLKLTIYPTSLDLASLSISNIQLKGALAVDFLSFEDSTGTQPHLEKVDLPWEINTPENHIAADLKGLIYTQSLDKLSPFSANLQLWLTEGQFDAANTRAELKMNFDGMPTSLLLSPFTTHDLSPILGSIVDLNFKTFLDPTHEKQGYVDLSMDSTHLHVRGRFKLNHAATMYDMSKIPNIRLEVTPESFEYFKKIMDYSGDLKLAHPVTLSGELNQINLPLQEAWVDQAQIDFHLSTSDIAWQNAPTIPLKIESQFVSHNLLENVEVKLKAGGANPLTFEGTLSHPLNRMGKLNDWKAIGLRASMEGKKLSPNFIQSLLLGDQSISSKLQALFGDTLDLNISCDLKQAVGPMRAAASGPQGYVKFDGQLNQGNITLNHPLEGSVNLTPLFTQTFLTPNAPLLSTAMGAEKPVTFSLSPDQFSCPLFPFQMDRVKIGKGMLNLGKIRFRNEGELSSVLSFIHSISDPYFTIWFTPLYFSLDKGILTLKRLDLLVANSYTLASWGSLNLDNQQADLILGLSAQSLNFAFGIQGLDEHYLLQIPLRSAKGKVEIDKKKATGRITALIAQSQGGIKGKILGNILDAALSNGGEIAPPPTTQPFPWKDDFKPASSTLDNQNQAEIPSPTTDPAEGKKKKRKRNKNQDQDNPLKDIQEGAIQLLDGFFGK